MKPHLSACLAAACLSACGSVPSPARRCQDAAQCAAGSFCRDGSCVASAPPVAVATPPSAGPLPSHTLLRFDGSLSRDPDPGDAVAEWAWTARPVDAGCDPFPAASGGATVDLVFGCPGSFEVQLVVKDGTGLASAPAVVAVAVVLSPDAPSILMGSDVSVDHLCQGAPLLCAALPAAGSASLALSAAASSPLSTSFTYEWSVTLPAIQPPPRVVVDPPGSPAPSVRIETDGTAIAGDYLFTVRATDAYHLQAVGQQRVTVGNRAPVVAGGGPLAVPHAFDPAGRRFLAAGAVSATAADPDGDPVTPLGFSAHHSGDGAGAFEVAGVGWSADFAIAVPYSGPADGGYLLGAAGLSRSIELAVADANGARATASWDVQVTNRPPTVSLAPGTVAVDHAFDAAGSRYVASAAIGTASDPDGDPIVQAGPTGNSQCEVIPEVVGSGMLQVECSLPYTGVPAVAAFLGWRSVRVTAGDPWSSAFAGPATVSIGNRAPRVPSTSVAMGASCGAPYCCRPAADGCGAWSRTHGAGTATAVASALDDDGDPIRIRYAPPACVQVAPASLTCAPGACGVVEVSLCAEAIPCGSIFYTVAVDADDGAAVGTGTMTVDSGCPPPLP